LNLKPFETAHPAEVARILGGEAAGSSGEHERRTARLNEEIALNIGKGKKLVGIEILEAKEVLGAGKLPSVVLEGLTASTAPAAREKPSKKYGT